MRNERAEGFDRDGQGKGQLPPSPAPHPQIQNPSRLHRRIDTPGWRTSQIWQALQTAFSLSPQDYTLNQLRYDLRKMKGHGLLERVGKQYAYRLTEKGARVSAMFEPQAQALHDIPFRR